MPPWHLTCYGLPTLVKDNQIFSTLQYLKDNSVKKIKEKNTEQASEAQW